MAPRRTRRSAESEALAKSGPPSPPALTQYDSPANGKFAGRDLETVTVTKEDMEADDAHRAFVREQRALELECKKAGGRALADDDAEFLIQWRARNPR